MSRVFHLAENYSYSPRQLSQVLSHLLILAPIRQRKKMDRQAKMMPLTSSVMLLVLPN